MSHSAEINRANPTCFLFLIDQSGSMAEPAAGGDVATRRTKAQFVADSLNTLLQNLVLRCAKEEGIRGYFEVGILGYGNGVQSALGGTFSGRTLVSISELGIAPTRLEERTKKVEDGAGGLIDQKIKKPIWIEPVANGGTPMCQALTEAISTMSAWVASHPNSFPPSVIHITDGESTDGDPLPLMKSLCELATLDGNCVLYNFHISGNAAAREVVYPDDSSSLPDEYSKVLFEGASPLVPQVRAQAQRDGIPVSEASRGFIMNAQPVTIIQALDIGTKPSNLR